MDIDSFRLNHFVQETHTGLIGIVRGINGETSEVFVAFCRLGYHDDPPKASHASKWISIDQLRNIKLSEDSTMSSDPYYRLYISQMNKVTVVCMQDFDEDDYILHKFIKDKNGDRYRFDTEEEAIATLNQVVKPECIDPEYLDQTSFMKE